MDSQASLIQLVPQLESAMDGVADYSRTLAHELEVHHGIHTIFLSCDPRDSGNTRNDAAQIVRATARDAAALQKALCIGAEPTGRAAPVLLHYVNYAFEKRGCPFWLLDGLKEWKQRERNARLVTMFHELYAFGPPWSSSFWLSPVQRFLARELVRISDRSVTNREQSSRWLRRGGNSEAGRISVMPVFSSLGEPEQLVEWHARSAQLIVAGRSGSAQRAYGARRNSLFEACRALEIREIVDLGARADPVPKRIGDIPVSALGYLTPAQASNALAQARAGFIDYPSDFLGKSSVFAAYASHGLVPVVAQHRGTDETGLHAGTNYWVPEVGCSKAADFPQIARNAGAWYQAHNLEHQAAEFARLIRG